MEALKYFSLFIFALACSSLFSLSAAAVHRQKLPPELQSLVNATRAMSSSGYTTMSALALELYNYLPRWSEDNLTGLTIFAPHDFAFISEISGKKETPPRDTILLHFSPLYLSRSKIRSMKEIPTVSIQYDLINTSNFFGSEISICNVKMSPDPPIYDDGYVIVYSIGQIFNINSAKDTGIVVRIEL